MASSHLQKCKNPLENFHMVFKSFYSVLQHFRHFVDLTLHLLRILKLIWVTYTQQPADRKDFKLDSKRKQIKDPYKI